MLLFSRGGSNNKDDDDTSGTKKQQRAEKKMSRQNYHHEILLSQHCHEDAFDWQHKKQDDGHKDKEIHTGTDDNDSICSKLPVGVTAASLWKQYTDTILFPASLHPSDTDQVHAAWTRELLQLVTPRHLEKGLRRAPNHNALRKVMTIIQAKVKDPLNAPPLEVAVVGGSVTEGGGCDKLPERLNVSSGKLPIIRGGDCAWPMRLQYLIDAILGQGVIRIHNLAVGGTNSYLAVPVLDYWLFPQGSVLLEHGPDVIINAYAANDNLPPADKRGSDTNCTGDYSFFLNDGLDRSQQFLRTSLFSRPCQEDPLVLFVDEYLGNQHNFILGELFRFEAVDLLTDWYGAAGAMSSAQVVRRWIYADTNDEIFTAAWLDRKNKQNEEQWKVDVHFGMPGHVFIALTVAYSLLTMTLNYCEEETRIMPAAESHAIGRSGSANNHTTDNNNNNNNDLHSTVASSFVPASVLQLVDEEVPPNLDVNLQVNDVAAKWSKDAVARKKRLDEYCGDGSGSGSNIGQQALPCSLAFVAAPMGTVRNAGALNGYMKQFIVTNDGWNGEQDMRNGWQNKLGFQANKPGASILLRIDKTPNRLKTITLHTLKSYGEKWAESKAKFSLQWNRKESGASYNTTFEILGYHNQSTSIAYPFVLDLGPNHIAETGSTLELQIDLVGGTTFKINAMMICSR
jgi:hypothetical protein